MGPVNYTVARSVIIHRYLKFEIFIKVVHLSYEKTFKNVIYLSIHPQDKAMTGMMESEEKKNLFLTF